MVWTLTEAQKYSTNKLQKGVIQTMLTESMVLNRFPFREVKGNAVQYNRETTLPTASFHSPNDTWSESTGTVIAYTAGIKILGAQSDLDQFEATTLNDQNDLEAELLRQLSKTMARKFEDKFIYGSSTTNPEEFDGLHALVDSTMVTNVGTTVTGAALSLAKLDATIQKIKPGRPDFILMNKNMQTRYIAACRGSISYANDIKFNSLPVMVYQGIPMLISDWILQTETISTHSYALPTTGACTSIFIGKFDTTEGLCGLQSGGIVVKRVGDIDDKDAVRWRIKWYLGMALFSIYSLAVIDGITDAAWTA